MATTRKKELPKRSTKVEPKYEHKTYGLSINVPLPVIPEVTDKTSFTSGATSSAGAPPYHLLSHTALSRWARRRELGAELHGDINFKKCVTLSTDGRVKVLDLGFIRDRFAHLIEHCYNVISLGNEDDDNIGAAFCNLEFLDFVEAEGFNLHRVFNPELVDETELAILATSKKLLWVKTKNGNIKHYSE